MKARWLLFLLVGFAQLVRAQSHDADAASGVPVHLRASNASPDLVDLRVQDEVYELIDIDTLFYIENEGLRRILAELNGHTFKLVVDPAEVRQSANAFLIPEYGEITFNIAVYIHPGEGNYLKLQSQGPEGSSAFVLIGDLLVAGQEVAFVLEDLRPLPEAFDLLRSYPNPSRSTTTITYQIPAHRTTGVPVLLAIYDAAGRRVRRLVDDWRFPGTFTLEWDGSSDRGGAAAGGVYFCHMTAGEMRQTIKLIRVP